MGVYKPNGKDTWKAAKRRHRRQMATALPIPPNIKATGSSIRGPTMSLFACFGFKFDYEQPIFETIARRKFTIPDNSLRSQIRTRRFMINAFKACYQHRSAYPKKKHPFYTSYMVNYQFYEDRQYEIVHERDQWKLGNWWLMKLVEAYCNARREFRDDERSRQKAQSAARDDSDTETKGDDSNESIEVWKSGDAISYQAEPYLDPGEDQTALQTMMDESRLELLRVVDRWVDFIDGN
ncbi:hypothetical protein GGR53DRAFT_526786 [Hypoxylon sp. FL1150]|nr:hypothetical protein GGR53DRAFT_526786 [Hypoxylon sp. FL1150]